MSDKETVLLVSVASLVAIGMISILVHRFVTRKQPEDAANSSMTRPVLAVILVGTLAILSVASMTGDPQTRNILVGGVISLGSAAAAFYFASSGATEARRDLLHAATDNVQVPDLVGKTVDEAKAALSAAGLRFLHWNPNLAGATTILSQNPAPGASAARSAAVTVQT